MQRKREKIAALGGPPVALEGSSTAVGGTPNNVHTTSSITNVTEGKSLQDLLDEYNPSTAKHKLEVCLIAMLLLKILEALD